MTLRAEVQEALARLNEAALRSDLRSPAGHWAQVLMRLERLDGLIQHLLGNRRGVGGW